MKLNEVNPDLREEFIRRGALNAIWKAHSADLAVEAVSQDIEHNPGLPPDKFAIRQKMMILAKTFLEKERDAQLHRALESLQQWADFKAGNLDESTVLT